MQGFQASVHDQPPGPLRSMLRSPSSLFTPHRLLYVLAAAALFIAAALLLNGGAAGVHNPGSHGSQQLRLETPVVSNTTDAPAEDTTAPPTASTSLQVNGQNIPVPTSGTTHQSTTDGHGTHTTVDTSTSQGSVSNTSTSSISVHVESNQSSTGDGSGQ